MSWSDTKCDCDNVPTCESPCACEAAAGATLAAAAAAAAAAAEARLALAEATLGAKYIPNPVRCAPSEPEPEPDPLGEPIGENTSLPFPLDFLTVTFLEGLPALPGPTVEGDGSGPLAGPGGRGGDEEDEDEEEEEDEDEEAAAP